MYPKLKKQFGNRVTYAQSPKSHVMVEFSFDVVQVAAAAYAPEAYHSFIGFRVAKPLLERAFSETYGIEMKDIFFNEDLAIGTYRHAVGDHHSGDDEGGVGQETRRDPESDSRGEEERRSSSTCAAGSTRRSSAPTTRSRTGSRASWR